MKAAVKPKSNRYHPLYVNPIRTFRGKNPAMGFLSNNFIVNNRCFNNPFYKYRMITNPLSPGNYKFKIVGVDDLSNENDGTEQTGAISDRPFYPTKFQITNISGNDITFTWEEPEGGASVDNYVIYGNGGSGDLIDRNTALSTLGGSTFTDTITVVDGDWKFVVEAISGSKESLNYYLAESTIPVEDTVQDGDHDLIIGVSLRNETVGKCRITFLWIGDDDVSHFRIYHDDATGTIDWGTYKYRFARSAGRSQNYLTSQICTIDENVKYLFGIRAETSYGVVGGNTNEYSVILDGIEPDEAVNVTVEER